MVYLKDGMGLFIAYNVPMNHIFWIVDRVVALARKKPQALGKSLDELIGDYLRSFADDDLKKSIAEFTRLSGRGSSGGWRFDRDEIHNRK
jgi:hypothetical protein